MCRSGAMVPSPRIATIKSSTALNMAKGGVHGKKKRLLDSTKKKKTKDPKRTGKHRKTSKRDNQGERGGPNSKSSSPTATSSTPRPKLSILGDSKKPGPPWQVMGENDMKNNVNSEKKRRERIRLGLDSPSAANGNNLSEKLKADVSGASRLLSATDRTMLNWKRFKHDAAPSDLVMVGAYLGKGLPPSLGVPEVAFLGRSNVGKSSLLNRLAFKTGGDIARVGKTPGATASVNLYALLGQPKRGGYGAGGEGKPILGFADLPGFGYAKLSKETKESVEEAAERYLGKRRELALGVLLVDSRRVPNPDDRAVLAALFDMGVPLAVVATKSDKLKASEVEPAMRAIREGLGLPDGQPLRVSGVTGEGVKDLWRIILDACDARVGELKSAIEEGKDDGGVLRLIADDDIDDDDFYADYDDEDDDEEEPFDDSEDVYYDQGYDWVQGSDNDSDNGGEDGSYDNFYDEDAYIEDDPEAMMMKKNTENEEKQRSEKEAFKLKNLKKVVRQMEKRGQI